MPQRTIDHAGHHVSNDHHVGKLDTNPSCTEPAAHDEEESSTHRITTVVKAAVCPTQVTATYSNADSLPAHVSPSSTAFQHYSDAGNSNRHNSTNLSCALTRVKLQSDADMACRPTNSHMHGKHSPTLDHIDSDAAMLGRAAKHKVYRNLVEPATFVTEPFAPYTDELSGMEIAYAHREDVNPDNGQLKNIDMANNKASEDSDSSRIVFDAASVHASITNAAATIAASTIAFNSLMTGDAKSGMHVLCAPENCCEGTRFCGSARKNSRFSSSRTDNEKHDPRSYNDSDTIIRSDLAKDTALACAGAIPSVARDQNGTTSAAESLHFYVTQTHREHDMKRTNRSHIDCDTTEHSACNSNADKSHAISTAFTRIDNRSYCPDENSSHQHDNPLGYAAPGKQAACPHALVAACTTATPASAVPAGEPTSHEVAPIVPTVSWSVAAENTHEELTKQTLHTLRTQSGHTCIVSGVGRLAIDAAAGADVTLSDEVVRAVCSETNDAETSFPACLAGRFNEERSRKESNRNDNTGVTMHTSHANGPGVPRSDPNVCRTQITRGAEADANATRDLCTRSPCEARGNSNKNDVHGMDHECDGVALHNTLSQAHASMMPHSSMPRSTKLSGVQRETATMNYTMTTNTSTDMANSDIFDTQRQHSGCENGTGNKMDTRIAMHEEVNNRGSVAHEQAGQHNDTERAGIDYVAVAACVKSTTTETTTAKPATPSKMVSDVNHSKATEVVCARVAAAATSVGGGGASTSCATRSDTAPTPTSKNASKATPTLPPTVSAATANTFTSAVKDTSTDAKMTAESGTTDSNIISQSNAAAVVSGPGVVTSTNSTTKTIPSFTSLSSPEVIAIFKRPAIALSRHLGEFYKRASICQTKQSRRNLSLKMPNNGYDDEDGHYHVLPDEHILDRYKVYEVLGKGSFGTVLRCYDDKRKGMVALKITRMGSSFRDQAKMELEILLKLNSNAHLNHLVVKLLKVFDWQGHLVLVFELLSFNLYQLIKCTRYNGVSLDLVRKFAYQLVHALLQLEQQKPYPIIHCDIKPENILLCNQNRSGLRLIDFGSACYINRRIHTYIQSRYYRSPEVILHQDYTCAIDRWSLGCVLVELHTGVPLFHGDSAAAQLAQFEAMLGPLPASMLAQSPHTAKYYKETNESGFVLREPALPPRKLETVLGVLTGGPRGSRLNTEGHDVFTYREFESFILGMLTYEPSERTSCHDLLRHDFLRPLFSIDQTQPASALKTT